MDRFLKTSEEEGWQLVIEKPEVLIIGDGRDGNLLDQIKNTGSRVLVPEPEVKSLGCPAASDDEVQDWIPPEIFNDEDITDYHHPENPPGMFDTLDFHDDKDTPPDPYYDAPFEREEAATPKRPAGPYEGRDGYIHYPDGTVYDYDRLIYWEEKEGNDDDE